MPILLFLPILRADLTPLRLGKLTALCHISHVYGAKQPVTCLLQFFTIQFSKPEGGKKKIQSVTVLKLRNASLPLGNLNLKYESVNLSFMRNLGDFFHKNKDNFCEEFSDVEPDVSSAGTGHQLLKI